MIGGRLIKFQEQQTEGLVYLMAKFMIIWMFDDNEPTWPTLVDFIDLVQNEDHRPWQILY